MSALLSLLAEMQYKIIAFLNYPDLTRLRATCRDMRDVPTTDIVRQALVRLEANWIRSGLLVRQRHQVPYMTFERRVPDPYAWSRDLEGEGYLPSELTNIKLLSPCYTCLRLRSCDDFETHDSNKPLCLSQHLRGSFVNYKHKYTRQCVNCRLEATDLSQRSPRYLVTSSGIIMACKSCDQIKKLFLEVTSVLQLRAEMCDECFAEEDAKLKQYMAEIESTTTRYQMYLAMMERIMRGNGGDDLLEGLRMQLPQPPRLPDFKYLD